MYPQQPQQPAPLPPNPTDYLNQISQNVSATPALRPTPKLFLLVGAALVILVIIAVVIVNIVVGAQKEPLQRLSARLTTTQTVAETSQENLKSSQLRSLNSNLRVYLTNTQRSINTPLVAKGIDIKKIPESVTKKESGSAMSAVLEDARLNNVFDRTYAREMAYHLANTLTLMRQIRQSAGEESLKEFLDDAIVNLEPTQASFANFDAAK